MAMAEDIREDEDFENGALLLKLKTISSDDEC